MISFSDTDGKTLDRKPIAWPWFVLLGFALGVAVTDVVRTLWR